MGGCPESERIPARGKPDSAGRRSGVPPSPRPPVSLIAEARDIVEGMSHPGPWASETTCRTQEEADIAIRLLNDLAIPAGIERGPNVGTLGGGDRATRIMWNSADTDAPEIE